MKKKSSKNCMPETEPMEIGVSTASYFNRLQVESAVGDIAAHGVGLCEVFLNSFCEYQPGFIRLLKERVEEAGIKVFSVHPMSTQFEPMMFSAHNRQREDAWKLFELVLQGARDLGAAHYVMHGPANLSGAAKGLEMERIAPAFRDMIQMAASYGVTLTLENVSWCLFCFPEYGAALQEAVGGGLKFTLDVKQAIRAGKRPEDFIAAVGGDIVNLHLCDALRQGEGKVALTMPGRGEVDFASIRDGLRAHGYSGPAFIEVYSDMYGQVGEIYESREAMRRIFNG